MIHVLAILVSSRVTFKVASLLVSRSSSLKIICISEVIWRSLSCPFSNWWYGQIREKNGFPYYLKKKKKNPLDFLRQFFWGFWTFFYFNGLVWNVPWAFCFSWRYVPICGLYTSSYYLALLRTRVRTQVPEKERLISEITQPLASIAHSCKLHK